MSCSTYKLVVFDFDGVFSNGKFYFGNEKISKSYNGRDSYGLKLLKDRNIKLGLISKDISVDLKDACHLYSRLDYCVCDENCDKLQVLEKWRSEQNLHWSEICYMGDDLADLYVLQKVGLAACPCDAVPQVKAVCSFISEFGGGFGAVRSFCDYILASLKNPCICIPARFKSSRLPEKLMLKIDGQTIIRRTCTQALKTGFPVFVFTDDDSVQKEVQDIVDVIMTVDNYENGTERIACNINKVPDSYDVIINVQGDEPFVHPQNIIRAYKYHKLSKDAFYTTLHEKCSPQEAKNPARVKVAISGEYAK